MKLIDCPNCKVEIPPTNKFARDKEMDTRLWYCFNCEKYYDVDGKLQQPQS